MSKLPRRERPAFAAGRRGFTLVEITVVIVLIGIVASVAAPRLLERSALDERAAADALRGLLPWR